MINPKPITKAIYIVVGEVSDGYRTELGGTSVIVSKEVQASGKFDARLVFHAEFGSGHTTTYIEAVYGPYERVKEDN